MWYNFLADVVVAVHVAYMAFIIVGQLAIWVGAACKWHWIRNPWFRISHLSAIAIVAIEAIFGIRCPLTVWEDRLREHAGQIVEGGTFVGRFLHNLLFHDYPQWIFTTAYIVSALLVLTTFVWAPPRLRRAPLAP